MRPGLSRATPWLALACLVAGCGGAAPQDRAADRPNVLLVSIDTLRADHLGCYGYGRDTSPNIDAFAADAVRYEHASAPRAKTTPSVASMLTGLYPHDHGVRDLSAPLATEDQGGPLVLADQLRRLGWRTAAVVGNYVLTDARSGLARGFTRWVEELPDVRGVPPHDAPQRTAGSLTDAALELLADPGFGADGERPFFLWLHYMDPHGAYAAPEEHRIFAPEAPDWIPAEDELAPSALHRRRVADYNAPPATRGPDGAIDAAAVRALYDAEIHYVDAELGRLLEFLRETGLIERTLVVLTSDHGESLGEHRYWFEHGAYAYQATCHVPLIVRWPDPPSGRCAPGSVDPTPVSLVDVAPTIYDAIGAGERLPGVATTLTGTSLGRLHGPSDPEPDIGREAAVFMEKVERADLDRAVQIKAVRIANWKLIRRYTHVTRDGERELLALSDELYDLAADPLETNDLGAQPPPHVPLDLLRAELLRFAAADTSFPELDEILRRRREALEASDPEALRVLRSLGY